MIALTHSTLTLSKRVSLAISRGTRTASQLAWVRVSAEGIEGWGEAGEFSIGTHRCTLEEIERDLVSARTILQGSDPLERRAIDMALVKAGCGKSVRSAINQALWDWIGRKVSLPVHRLLGVATTDAPPTSVTIGIAPPDQAVQRVHQWNAVGQFKVWKIKLGAPAGIESDRVMFEAVRAVLPASAQISVDANGGWSASQAIDMCRWLADRGVDHVEQPLPRGEESRLADVVKASPLPLIADESCLCSREIPKLIGLVQGVNIKLFKCGGFDEALRMIATAKAHDLRVMLGCYGNTALSNTAAAHLGGLVDYVDLDSHLNLQGDPFQGATLEDGVLRPNSHPGFGVHYVPTDQA